MEKGDHTFRQPEREEIDWDYRPLCQLQPRDPAKPHLGVIMGDSKVTSGADQMLVSELHAAVEMSKPQLSCGDFTTHHTKPVRLAHCKVPTGQCRWTPASCCC